MPVGYLLGEPFDAVYFLNVFLDDGLSGIVEKQHHVLAFGLCQAIMLVQHFDGRKGTTCTSFAAGLGQLLYCNHVYNQYVCIEDSLATLKKLEAKLVRLQSLAAYSRENAIGRDATDAFLNEAIGEQRVPGWRPFFPWESVGGKRCCR